MHARIAKRLKTTRRFRTKPYKTCYFSTVGVVGDGPKPNIINHKHIYTHPSPSGENYKFVAISLRLWDERSILYLSRLVEVAFHFCLKRRFILYKRPLRFKWATLTFRIVFSSSREKNMMEWKVKLEKFIVFQETSEFQSNKRKFLISYLAISFYFLVVSIK